MDKRSPVCSTMIHINMFGWTLISRQRRFVVLVDWTMNEDKKNVHVCVCAVVYLGGVGFGGMGWTSEIR